MFPYSSWYCKPRVHTSLGGNFYCSYMAQGCGPVEHDEPGFLSPGLESPILGLKACLS